MTDLEAASIEDVRDFFRTYYVPNNATARAGRRLRLEGSARAGHAVSRPGAEVGEAGAAGHPQGAAADQGAARQRSPRPGRCRRSSSPTTSPTTGTRTRIRCTSPRRCCRTARARASIATSSTTKQIALAAFGGGNIIEDPNLFFAVAIVQPGKTPQECIDALIAEFDKLTAEPISANELQQAKNQFARDYILGRESDKDKAAQLAHAVVIHNDIKTADGEFDIFMNITAADVQRVAKTYFTPENRLVMTIMPKGGGSGGGALTVASCGACRCTLLAAVLPLSARRRCGLAVGAPAAAAAGARGQVPALQRQDAAEWPAGDCRLASRAAGGQPPPDRARRRRPGPGRQAGCRRSPRRCSIRARPRRTPSRSPARSTRSAARSAPAPAATCRSSRRS